MPPPHIVLPGVGVVCAYVPCYKIVHTILWKSGSKRDISQNFFLVAAVGNLKIDLTKSGSTPKLGFTHFARKKANFCVLSKILVVFCVLPIFG